MMALRSGRYQMRPSRLKTIREAKAALEQLNRLHGLVRLYVNFFQPVMKLRHKTRRGARVHKVYDVAGTPYQRLLESSVPNAQ